MKRAPLQVRNMALAVLALLAITHFYFLMRSAVDIPYYDEWLLLKPGRLAPQFSLRWIFGFDNEHRAVWTKLLIWILYHIDGWNIVTHQAINFIFFGALAGFFVAAKDDLIGPDNFPVFPLFVCFLFSPIAWESHTGGYQAHQYGLLMGYAGLYLLTEKMDFRARAAGAALTICAAYAFAGGLVFPIAGAIIAGDRRLKILPLIFVALWFVGYHPVAAHAEAMRFGARQFADFFLNLIALGFGVERVSAWTGLFWFAVASTPFASLLFIMKKRDVPGVRFLSAAFACTLGIMLLTALGRAGAGVDYAKESRYAQLGMMLIPLTALAMYAAFTNEKWRTMALSAFFICLTISFADNVSFAQYDWVRKRNEFTVNCVREFYHGKKGLGICTSAAPWPLLDSIRYADQINVSFMRKIRRS